MHGKQKSKFEFYKKITATKSVSSEAVVRRCSVKKVSLKNFTKFTGKHLCQSLFFNKVASLRPETLAQVFSREFCEIFKNTFFYRTPPVAASVS